MFEKMFESFGDTGNFLQTLASAANQKAAAAKETAAVAVEQKSEITDLSADYAAQAQQTLERYQVVESKGAEARRLAESDNIFDRITLVGEQILNPRDFTAEGRSRQVSEMSQGLAMQGQIHGIQTNAALARIDEAMAREVATTAGVDANMSAMRAQVDGLQLMSQGIQATETLRMQNLAQVDLPTLNQASIGPTPKGSKINLGGMEYTPVEIQERQKQLTTRASLAMLSPMSTDPDFAQKVSVHHNLQLATMTQPELEELKNNGYILDGQQVSPQLFDEHYSRQNRLQMEAFANQANAVRFENQLPVMLEQSQALHTNITKHATPGTPLYAAATRFQMTANHIASLSKADSPPEAKAAQIVALQKEQEDLVKTVDFEANRKAAGDKELALIYRSEMLGEEIQPAQIEDVVRSRYTKGKGFGDIFDSATATRLRSNADKFFMEAQRAQASSYTGLEASKSEKELRAQAVEQALEAERIEAGVEGINMIHKFAVKRKDHPAVKAGMIPGMLEKLQMEAHSSAMIEIMGEKQLSQEKMMAIKAQTHAALGITDKEADDIRVELNNRTFQTEYDMYDRHKPGLGYEMEQWYATALPEMARNYTANLNTMQRTLAGDSILQEAQTFAMRYRVADETATGRGRQLAIEAATGAKKPENMWPVLLHMNERLANPQRQAIYFDIVMPALQQARANGANDEVATAAAFEALTKFKSDDPTLMSALKITQRELPAEMEKFHTMWAAVMARNQPNRIRAQVVGKDPELAADQLDKVMPWLNRN